MGQLMSFYAGDADRIGRAFVEGDHATLSDRTKVPAHVDFSIHVSAIDLDIMTEAASTLVGAGPQSFLDSCERVAGDGEERAAEQISSSWVELISKVDAEPLANAWALALREEYSDPSIVATDDMRHGLAALVSLCRDARQRGVPVVHTWSL